jgi:lipopolysaccharide/colanic/teichoic acid biosynthesis glycosyltransferase
MTDVLTPDVPAPRPLGRLRPLRRVAREATVRVLDVTVAVTVLVLAAPLVLVVYLLVRLSSPGSGLFRQVRVGADRREFVMYKFRTMRRDCDTAIHQEYVRRLLSGQVKPENGLYKLVDDPRVTRVGALLRRSSLDELPQLLNVLKGEMSIVGPRPCLPWEMERFPDWATDRFAVRPGLTGLWQVSGRNRLTMLDGLRLDVEYVARRTLVLNLVIMLRTVPALLGRGAR